jgi:hypothetical protein
MTRVIRPCPLRRAKAGIDQAVTNRFFWRRSLFATLSAHAPKILSVIFFTVGSSKAVLTPDQNMNQRSRWTGEAPMAREKYRTPFIGMPDRFARRRLRFFRTAKLKKILVVLAVAVASTAPAALSVTAQDCACGRRGCSGECSSRQEAPRGYTAQAVCSMTGAVGRARGGSVGEAAALAIDDCIRRGGVPACCERGVSFY